mmetsp:Transcript_12818/g.21284  ORF Transcript_12818/g.21284 Transcript_12818/m.21284 type:complete len:258 (+) Transcript_12818:279-1052(+)
MVPEESFFLPETFPDTQVSVDILLSTINHSDVATSQGNDFVVENITGISPGIHEVKLREHSYSPVSVWVDRLSELQRITIGNVGICTGDGENDSIRIGNVLQAHLTDLLFDIYGLVANRIFSHSRQVHEGQSQDFRRIHFEMNGSRMDSFIFSSKAFSFSNNFGSDDREIIELSSRHMQELAPLFHLTTTAIILFGVIFIFISFLRQRLSVVELKNQGATCNNAVPSGKKRAPNDTFQNTGFSRALATYDYNLRQVK